MKFKWAIEIDINLEGSEYSGPLTNEQAKCAFVQAQSSFFDSLYGDDVDFKITKENV